MYKQASQLVSNTLDKLYKKASEGEKVNPNKIHACWEVGSKIRKEGKEVKPLTKEYLFNKVYFLLVYTYVIFDRELYRSKPHIEPHSSRISGWAYVQRLLIFDKVEAPAQEDIAILSTHAEVLKDSGWADFNAAQLLADSHGFEILDERAMKREKVTAGVHSMATIADFAGYKMGIDIRTGRVSHKGLDYVHALMDEIGPWQYEFVTESGDVVTLGYEGVKDLVSEFSTERPLEIEGDSYVAADSHRQALENGYLVDLKDGRTDNFFAEFERAVGCSPERIVPEYRAAWTRYRASQLQIGTALKHAPYGHGLWGHVHLTKEQWKVIELIYAGKSGRTKKDRHGRPDIARERLNTRMVLKWAKLANSLI